MSKARILAVDDQRYFRELIERLLDGEGYAVRTCASGEEALRILEREDFDIVVTDLEMPGIDGAELVRRVKERLPDQDVVIVTGVVGVKTAFEAMRLGATDYILKPFDRGTLTDSLFSILATRRLKDEHARLMEENLEFMGVLSLLERASGLHSTLSLAPLAERLIEGLCLETRAQSGVVWVVEDPGCEQLELVGARGLVRGDSEPESVSIQDVEAAWCPGILTVRSVVASMPQNVDGVEALYLPIRSGEILLGLARLSDKIDGEPFDATDRGMAEKFCEFGGVAIHNALRFRALERRSPRDPAIRDHSVAYYEDAVRNEIQKSNRFGYRFSMIRIEIDGFEAALGSDGGAIVDRNTVEVGRLLECALRANDLMANADDGSFLLLLPQTDALGAGILAQLIRAALDALWEGREAPAHRFASATFPADGSRVEGLQSKLAERVEQSSRSLLAQRPEFARRQPLDPLLDRMLELGSVEPAVIEGQILRFVLEDVVRRPAERGVLYVSPGSRWLPEVFETLEDIRHQPTETEIILLAEGEVREPTPQVTWIAKSGLDSRRPFLVYFGEGPAYAMFGQVTLVAARAAIFQTSDRALVEYLAFELQRELGITLSV